jgi:transposase
MSRLTPESKDEILRQYLPSSRDNSFEALAHRYNIKGGKGTIQRWYARWDGTPSSLEQRAGAGRPRLLSAAQIRDTIALPIRNRNRSHQAVHYTELFPTVRDKTEVSVSLRTIQRYGKEIVRARDRSTRSRTAAESKYK